MIIIIRLYYGLYHGPYNYNILTEILFTYIVIHVMAISMKVMSVIIMSEKVLS